MPRCVRLQAAKALIMKDELHARRRVLIRMGYLQEDGVVTMKGRAAAEISSGHELVATEASIHPVLGDLCTLPTPTSPRLLARSDTKVEADRSLILTPMRPTLRSSSSLAPSMISRMSRWRRSSRALSAPSAPPRATPRSGRTFRGPSAH